MSARCNLGTQYKTRRLESPRNIARGSRQGSGALSVRRCRSIGDGRVEALIRRK